MRIMLLTAGSRGDVEPFLALAQRAQAVGHEVRLGALLHRRGFGTTPIMEPFGMHSPITFETLHTGPNPDH